MVKRTQRASPRPARRTESDRPAWPVEGHSGEGAKSALEVLRRLEQSRRVGARQPHGDEDRDTIA